MNRRKFISAATVLPTLVCAAQADTQVRANQSEIELLFYKFKFTDEKADEILTHIVDMLDEARLSNRNLIRLESELLKTKYDPIYNEKNDLKNKILQIEAVCLKDIVIKANVILWDLDDEECIKDADQIKYETASLLMI